MIPTRQSVTLAIKLASIVTHAEELSTPDTGHPYDATVILALIRDPEVATWLDSFDQVLLPLKRFPREVV